MLHFSQPFTSWTEYVELQVTLYRAPSSYLVVGNPPWYLNLNRSNASDVALHILENITLTCRLQHNVLHHHFLIEKQRLRPTRELNPGPHAHRSSELCQVDISSIIPVSRRKLPVL